MMGCFVHTRRKQINTNKAVTESGAPVSETQTRFSFACFSSFELIRLLRYFSALLSSRGCLSHLTQEQFVFTWICSGVHWSRLTDLTLEMWTPRLRWIPAQRIHMNTPRFQEAHRGPETGETSEEPRHSPSSLSDKGCMEGAAVQMQMQKRVMANTDSTGFL